MTAATRSRALARIFLVTYLRGAVPRRRQAQKPGGSITVGLEPTSRPSIRSRWCLRHRCAETAVICDLRNAHLSRRQRKGPAQARFVLGASEDFKI